MGVQEILEVLEKGNKLTCSEMSEKVGCCKRSVRRSIARLIKDVSEHLEFRILTKEEKEEKYGHKLSCEVRLFWLNK